MRNDDTIMLEYFTMMAHSDRKITNYDTSMIHDDDRETVNSPLTIEVGGTNEDHIRDYI